MKSLNGFGVLGIAACIGSAAALSACGGGGGGGGGGGPISLDQPNQVMSSLQNKVTSGGGGVPLVEGSVPVPVSADAPKATPGVAETKAAPGDTVSLPVIVEGSPVLSNLYAKLPNADSYFNVTNPDSSKHLLRKADTGVPVPVVVGSIVDFRVELPDNLDLTTGNQICFDFSVREQGSDVRSADVRSCITLEAETPTPQNDQPPVSALQGSWLSACQSLEFEDEEEVSDIRGARFGLSFVDGQKTFTQFFEYYGTNDCQPNSVLSEYSGFVIDGTYEVQATATYEAQNRRFQRELDFFPNDPFDGELPDIRVEPCYNIVSFQNQNTLYLGLPLTFTIDFGDGQAAPVPGDCREESTRPDVVLSFLPFTKQP